MVSVLKMKAVKINTKKQSGMNFKVFIGFLFNFYTGIPRVSICIVFFSGLEAKHN